MNERLDTILGIETPEPVADTIVTKNVIEQAADILQGEIVAAADTAVATVPATEPPAEQPADTPATKPILALPPDEHTEELNKDMEYARVNIKDVIDQGKTALQGILELAEAGDAPRAYEVVATVIGTIVQANKELIQLHKTRKDTLKTDKETKATEAGDSPATVNIKNAVFVGRAHDLLRSLKDVEKELNNA